MLPRQTMHVLCLATAISLLAIGPPADATRFRGFGQLKQTVQPTIPVLRKLGRYSREHAVATVTPRTYHDPAFSHAERRVRQGLGEQGRELPRLPTARTDRLFAGLGLVVPVAMFTLAAYTSDVSSFVLGLATPPVIAADRQLRRDRIARQLLAGAEAEGPAFESQFATELEILSRYDLTEQ
jgi:hypothetical protein